MSRLIVNADDLGLTSGIDRAVLALHRAGALSSATAMATGASLGSLVEQLQVDQLQIDQPQGGPGVGCHVVLVDGAPASPAAAIPSLVQPGLHSGLQSGLPAARFRPSLSRFVADLERGRIRDREMEEEAVAQIRRLQALGLRLTHLDTHKHTHIFPRVLRPLLRAALRSGIHAVRNPFEPVWARAATAGAPAMRRLQVRLLSAYRRNFLREVDRAGMATTGGALGVLATGTLAQEQLESLLRAAARYGSSEECYELVCHPGFHDADLQAQPTRLRAERERERLALLEVIPRWSGPNGPHRLVSFGDLRAALP